MSQCPVDNYVHNFCGEEAVNSLARPLSTPCQYYSDRDFKITGRPSQVGQRPQLLSQFDRRDTVGPVGAMTDRGTPPGRSGRFAMVLLHTDTPDLEDGSCARTSLGWPFDGGVATASAQG